MKKYLFFLVSAALLISFKAFPQHSGPVSQSACLGEIVEFTVEHSFDYVTFAWEESTDNISFTPVTSSGYTTIEETLMANTGVLNPPVSGYFRSYRCYMFSNIYGETYSDTATLEINFPPVIDSITFTNPCKDQTTHFIPIITGGLEPLKYLWDFDVDSTSISVYSDPYFIFTTEKTYKVKLTVTDANGCVDSLERDVQIISIPPLTITGKPVVCSNELNVKYSVDLEGDNVHYEWDVAGFGTIEDDTLREPSIKWTDVDTATQTQLTLTVTIDPWGCSTKISYDVLITNYVAPPEGTIFWKPDSSTVLIYRGPEVNSYRWGFTTPKGEEPPVENNQRFYCDFMTLDPANEYWVETSYDFRINCVTRSYFAKKKDKLGGTETDGAFTVYPVPAYGQLNVRFDESFNPSGIAIYNMMMQKVYENTSLVAEQKEYAISLKNFISGIYIIQVTGESGINNFRVFTIEK